MAPGLAASSSYARFAGRSSTPGSSSTPRGNRPPGDTSSSSRPGHLSSVLSSSYAGRADEKKRPGSESTDAGDLEDVTIAAEDLDANDFAKLYELDLPTTTFCEELQLANDATDGRRVVVARINADLSRRSGVAVGDVLIAISGRCVPRKTPAVELARLVRERARGTATTFRFWHVGGPSVAGGDTAVTRMEGVEFTATHAARKQPAARWGRVQLKLGNLNLARYFVAVRTPDAGHPGHRDADAASDGALSGRRANGSAPRHHQTTRRVRRGDILVGVDHEPLPILITSSDLQYRLNRGSASQPVTLNVFRVTDPTLAQRILTCCDIADLAGGYAAGDARGGASYYGLGGPADRSGSAADRSGAFARCHKCEGSSLSSACLCMI